MKLNVEAKKDLKGIERRRRRLFSYERQLASLKISESRK